jgi:hypothetical protein
VLITPRASAVTGCLSPELFSGDRLLCSAGFLHAATIEDVARIKIRFVLSLIQALSLGDSDATHLNRTKLFFHLSADWDESLVGL